MDKVKIGFPIEYEDENNIVRNGLFLREPEIKELEKRLKEINKITDLKQQCKKQKEVISKTINAIDLVIELIKQQPTEDDRWILDRLNGFKIILEDKEVSK